MASMHLNRQTLDRFEARAKAIGPDTRPQWGRMDPPQVMAHLARVLDMCLGHVELPDQANVLTRTLLRWIVLDGPWPKGKVKAPDNFTPAPTQPFDAERRRVIELMREFVDVAERAPDRLRPSPVLGRLSALQWRKLQGRHLDHHLRQFGA
jgi:hypothetical protein